MARLHIIRRAMVVPGGDRLSCFIKTDETFAGAERPCWRGRGGTRKGFCGRQVAAYGKGNDRIGRIDPVAVIPDASQESLTSSTTEVVEPDGIICTVDWYVYSMISDAGYLHDVVCSHGFKNDYSAASLINYGSTLRFNALPAISIWTITWMKFSFDSPVCVQAIEVYCSFDLLIAMLIEPTTYKYMFKSVQEENSTKSHSTWVSQVDTSV